MAQFKRDKMTEKERWEYLFKRQPVDRVPLCLYSMSFAARNTGLPIARMYDDPEISFSAQLRTNEMYDATHYTCYFGGAFGAREFGGEVKMPESEYEMAVSLLRPRIESEEDIFSLELPDVKRAGVMPFFMRFSRLQEKHGLPITVFIGSTLTVVGFICGVERMCRWMIKEPELVHRLCRLETDFMWEIAKYWVDTFGPERILALSGSPTESNQVISPKHFKEFALPYQMEIYNKIESIGIKHVRTHLCGEQNMNLPYWSMFSHGNPGIISIGPEVDIEEAAKYFPNDIIFGNVDPIIIQTGTPEEVYEMARECIEKGKKCPGGFILAPGCELPPMSPPYNVWMLRKAVNDFGWYD